MINPLMERIFPLLDAPDSRCSPRRANGKKLHQNTYFRFARDGCRGIRLETIRVGRSLCTSDQAIARFFAALTARDESLRSAGQDDLGDTDLQLEEAGF